jgi:hypothetical protein
VVVVVVVVVEKKHTRRSLDALLAHPLSFSVGIPTRLLVLLEKLLLLTIMHRMQEKRNETSNLALVSTIF